MLISLKAYTLLNRLVDEGRFFLLTDIPTTITSWWALLGSIIRLPLSTLTFVSALVSGSGCIAVVCTAMLGTTVHAVTVSSTIAIVQKALPAKECDASRCFTLGLNPGRLGVTLVSVVTVFGFSQFETGGGTDTSVSISGSVKELSFVISC